jgi:hypothetical protein
MNLRVRSRRFWPSQCPAGRRGVALPVVVLCLASLTVLLLGLVLTASTELVVSLAHRDTTEDLYASEAAIHAWISERGSSMEPDANESWTPMGSTDEFRVVVEQMAASGAAHGHSLFFVHAEATRGLGQSRAVSAMIRTRPYTPALFVPLLEATITAGGDSRVERTGSGGYSIRDGTSSLCSATGQPAGTPFMHAAGTSLQVVGTGVLEGAPDLSDEGSVALLAKVLDGHLIRDLAWNSDIRFGRHFNEPRYRGREVAGGATEARLDWGCPAALIAALPPGSIEPCPAGADPDRWPIVAIDAENDTVRLFAYHGQGTLIVVNGHLHIDGPFVYRGLILAERSVRIGGGGVGWPPSIAGAIVAGGGVSVLDGRDPESGAATSNRRVVLFDGCAVGSAVDAFNTVEAGRWKTATVLGRPFAWAEVMR